MRWLLVLCLAAFSMPVRGATPEALGFTLTPLGREDTARAIGYANAILGSQAPFQLVSGWDAGPGAAEGTVPVWPIGSPGNPGTALMEVPKGCRCVVVRIRDIRAWTARAQTVNQQRALSFDMPYLLTFMLLHEAGHIAAGHAGQLDGVGDATVIGPEQRLTMEQCREIEADAFAARAVRDGIENVGAPGWMEAWWTSTELSKLSFNLFGKRLIDHFPADALGLPEVFGDRTYSHPNFDLRIYALNADIAQDETSKQLLEAFIGKRLKIGRPDLTCGP